MTFYGVFASFFWSWSIIGILVCKSSKQERRNQWRAEEASGWAQDSRQQDRVLWQPPECHPSACLHFTRSPYNNLYCWSSGPSARAYFFVFLLEGFVKCANIWTDNRWFPFERHLSAAAEYVHEYMATRLRWVTTTGGDNEEIVELENSGKLSVRSVIANTHLTGGRACLSQSAVWVGCKRN